MQQEECLAHTLQRNTGGQGGMEGGKGRYTSKGALSSLEEMHSCSLAPDLSNYPETLQFFQPEERSRGPVHSNSFLCKGS